MTQRIELFVNDSKELSLFYEPLLNKSWIFLFLTQRIELFFFLSTTQWIEPIFYVTQKIEIFGWKSQKMKLFIFFENSKLIFFTWLEELNPPFSTWLRELFFFEFDSKFFLMDSKNRTPFFQYDSTNRTLFKMWLFSMIQRIEPLFWKNNSKNWTWLKDLNSLFSNLIQRIGLILMTPRLEASFLNYDTEFLLKIKWLKELDQILWLKEMIFLYDSKNWFFCMTQRIETFFFEYDAENWNLFLWIWRRELNPFSFLPQIIETFSSLPQIIEPFFQKFWLKELNFFSDMTQRNEFWKKKKDSKSWTCFFKMTYRIEPLLFSLIWFKELNFVSKKRDSKKRNLLLEKWLKELNSL